MNVQSREYRHVDRIVKTGTLLLFYIPGIISCILAKDSINVCKKIGCISMSLIYIEFEVSIAAIIASL